MILGKAILGCAVATAALSFVGAEEVAPKRPQAKVELPPDALVKMMMGPVVDRALEDPEFRQRMNDQQRRVHGQKMDELSFLSALDRSPSLKRSPFIRARMREQMGLPKEPLPRRDRPAAGAATDAAGLGGTPKKEARHVETAD